MGKRKNCRLPMTFCSCTAKRRCPDFGGSGQVVAFEHYKGIEKFKLACTLPNLGIVNCRSRLTQNFGFSKRATKIGRKKSARTWSADLHWSLHVKLYLLRHLFPSRQFDVNQLLGLTPANSTRFLCVNPCPQVFIQDRIFTKTCKGSNTKNTRYEALAARPCLFFNESNPRVK